MPRDPFNLIITHYPGYDNYIVARQQVTQALPEATIVDTSQSIMLVRVPDPYQAVEVLRSEIRGDTPLLRIIPVDTVTDVYIDRVAPKAREITLRKSKPEESFAIKLDGRLYAREGNEIRRLGSREAIDLIAEGIDRPVNLTSPHWLVYVKVIRLYRVTELASITVARPHQIHSYARPTHPEGGGRRED